MQSIPPSLATATTDRSKGSVSGCALKNVGPPESPKQTRLGILHEAQVSSTTSSNLEALIRRQPSHSDGGGTSPPGPKLVNPYPTKKSSAIARLLATRAHRPPPIWRDSTAYRPGENDQAEVGDARVRCVEHILSGGITAERRRAWRDGWMGNLRDDGPPGRGVERVGTQGDERLNEWRQRAECRRSRAVTGSQKRTLVNQRATAECRDAHGKPDVVRRADDEEGPTWGNRFRTSITPWTGSGAWLTRSLAAVVPRNASMVIANVQTNNRLFMDASIRAGPDAGKESVRTATTLLENRPPTSQGCGRAQSGNGQASGRERLRRGVTGATVRRRPKSLRPGLVRSSFELQPAPCKCPLAISYWIRTRASCGGAPSTSTCRPKRSSCSRFSWPTVRRPSQKPIFRTVCGPTRSWSKRIWPTSSARIRQVLGESPAGAGFIRTVPRFGYAFHEMAATDRETATRPVSLDASRRRVALAVGAVVLVAAAASVALSWVAARHDEPARIRLAVLPFQNLTGDPSQDYLCDGLTEEMIAQLGGLQPSRLSVIARTSALQYKNTSKRAKDIARELGVQFLLETSVRRTGDRVRIAAQLIEADSQTHVWAEQNDHDLQNLLVLQREVAAAITRRIFRQLRPCAAAERE